MRKKYYQGMEYPINEKKIHYEDVQDEMIEMGVLVEQDENGEEIDVVDKSLKELEALLQKNKIIELDVEDLELLNEHSDDEEGKEINLEEFSDED